MRYWVFNEEQLNDALVDACENTEEIQMIQDFLYGDLIRERGLRQGDDDKLETSDE